MSWSCPVILKNNSKNVLRHQRELVSVGFFAAFGSIRVTLRIEQVQEMMCRSGAKIMSAVSEHIDGQVFMQEIMSTDFYRVVEMKITG